MTKMKDTVLSVPELNILRALLRNKEKKLLNREYLTIHKEVPLTAVWRNKLGANLVFSNGIHPRSQQDRQALGTLIATLCEKGMVTLTNEGRPDSNTLVAEISDLGTSASLAEFNRIPQTG